MICLHFVHLCCHYFTHRDHGVFYEGNAGITEQSIRFSLNDISERNSKLLDVKKLCDRGYVPLFRAFHPEMRGNADSGVVLESLHFLLPTQDNRGERPLLADDAPQGFYSGASPRDSAIRSAFHRGFSMLVDLQQRDSLRHPQQHAPSSETPIRFAVKPT